jgi:MFS family permease
MKTSYLAGTIVARAGGEMSGPAVLLLSFAASGAAATGSVLLASLTLASAMGGPVLGTLLDRSRRPDRLLAGALAAYALGIAALAVTAGRLPLPAVVPIALAAGVSFPAVEGGWTSQLPRIVTVSDLPRASALDALTYDAGSLAGPALAAVATAWVGARLAVGMAAALVGITVPVALTIFRASATAALPRTAARSSAAGHRPDSPARQLAAGFAAIVRRRALLRATVTSAVSYVGIGMLIVCCPLLGRQRLGGEDHGALLISAMAVTSLAANALLANRHWRSRPDTRVLTSTLFIGAGIAAAAMASGWLVVLAVAVAGVGSGPQLTALFEVRHREAPEHMRGQIFTTAASLKIAGFAAGAALAGPLAGRSLTACLLIAAGIEAAAAAAYLACTRRPSRLAFARDRWSGQTHRRLR